MSDASWLLMIASSSEKKDPDTFTTPSSKQPSTFTTSKSAADPDYSEFTAWVVGTWDNFKPQLELVEDCSIWLYHDLNQWLSTDGS